MCGTATKVNYLKEGLIYSHARHTLNPVQTGLRLQYSTCWSTLAQRQIQIGLPYLPRRAGTEVRGISSPLRLFPAGSADELIKAMISRKRTVALNKGQGSAAAQSFACAATFVPNATRQVVAGKVKQREGARHTHTHAPKGRGGGGCCNYSAVGNNQHNQRPRVQITAVEHTEHHPAPIFPFCIRTQHFIADLC